MRLYQYADEIRQLHLIKRLLNAGNKQKAKKLVIELFETVKDTPLTFVIEYRELAKSEKGHFPAYGNHCRQMKNKALGDLQELDMELTRHDTCIKRCTVIIENLIQTRFHSATANRKIKQWQPVANKFIRTDTITI